MMTPIDEYHFQCTECGLVDNHKMSCSSQYQYKDKPDEKSNGEYYWEETDVVDEDWLSGISCNPDEPEACESCQ